MFQEATKKTAIPVLDGVRAIACLTVLFYHINLISIETHTLSFAAIGPLASSIAVAGSSGVTLFFVLSGFLLFQPYAKALVSSTPWPSARRFYLRRALRILPGYYFALFLLILCTRPEYFHPEHLKDLGLFVTLFMDSAPQTYMKINGPFWTLAVEWQFYLLLPLLALGFRLLLKRLPERRRGWALAVLLVALMGWGVLSRYWGMYLSAHPTATVLVPRSVLNIVLFFLYGSSGKYLEDFAVGMLISLCYVISQQASPQHPLGKRISRLSWWLWGAGILWLFIVAMWHFNHWFHQGLFFFEPLSPYYDWSSELAISLGYGLCVLALLFGPVLLRLPFEWRPLRWVGLISYSVYIWHVPILKDFSQHIRPLEAHPQVHYALFVACALLIIIPFSYAIYKWIESPWMNMHLQREHIPDKQAIKSAMKTQEKH